MKLLIDTALIFFGTLMAAGVIALATALAPQPAARSAPGASQALASNSLRGAAQALATRPVH
jgi:hypothetical protein